MSEQTLRRVERIADLRAAMPWLVAAGIYVLVIAVAPQLLGDPDTCSHLALGRFRQLPRNVLARLRVALRSCVRTGVCGRRLDGHGGNRIGCRRKRKA